MDSKDALVVFEGRKIRRTWNNSEWWFAIVDVVAALTDSVNPQGYIKDMRRRDLELVKGCGQIATPLSIQRLKDDGGIQAHIRQIQAHPWVRMVEGE